MNNIKKFENFLDRMQGLIDDAKKQGHIIVRLEDLENAFPELKENEDEKIRKAIISLVKQSSEVLNKSNQNDMIAWLEKQGTTIKFFSDEFEWALGRIIAFWNQNHKDGIFDENELMSYIKGRETELIKLFTDNVCKVSLSDCSEEYRKAYYDGYNKCNRDWLEKQGEQKPSDKIEPKFKVGDWVVFNDKHDSIYQVENIENYQYTLKHTLGGLMPLPFSSETMIRHFTIEHDAKDGDVLANGDFIFIYNNRCNLQAYCYYSKERNRLIIEDMGHTCHWNMQEVTPATKEQRDTLEKAMTDAEYEWNANEKKLNKINQKPADETSIAIKNEDAYKIGFADGEAYANEQKTKTTIESWKEMRLETYQQATGNKHEANNSNDNTKMFSLNDIDEIVEKITEIQNTQK